MAFKMKGNPYKMGNVATKSALKDTGSAASDRIREVFPEKDERQVAATTKAHNKVHTDQGDKGAHGKEAVFPMKSPLEHKRETDGKYIVHDGKRMKQTHSHINKEGKKMTEEEVTEANLRKESMAKMKSPLEQSWWETAKDYGGKAWDVGKDAVKKTYEQDKKMKKDLWDEATQIGMGLAENTPGRGGGFPWETFSYGYTKEENKDDAANTIEEMNKTPEDQRDEAWTNEMKKQKNIQISGRVPTAYETRRGNMTQEERDAEDGWSTDDDW